MLSVGSDEGAIEGLTVGSEEGIMLGAIEGKLLRVGAPDGCILLGFCDGEAEAAVKLNNEMV